VPATAPILDRDERPAWIGPAAHAEEGADGRVAWAVYPVCTASGDDRCAEATAAAESLAGARP
jgi:hypothetical protein